MRPVAPDGYQAPGQIDEYIVLDVDGTTGIYDLTYWPDTPQEFVEQMRADLDTATYSQ